MLHLRVTLPLAAMGCALLAGCAAISQQPADADMRAVQQEVLTTVRTVKTGSEPRYVSSRAVRLPTHELYSIAIFDYDLPATCGGHRFRLYESGSTQILEYSYELNGATYLIRDYVSGSSPFIQPGLWSSFDHTADSVTNMMTLFAEGSSRLAPRVYSKGLVTDLAVVTQNELDHAYRRAVKAAAQCGGAML